MNVTLTVNSQPLQYHEPYLAKALTFTPTLTPISSYPYP